MPSMGQRMGCPRVVLTLENTDGAGMSQSKASRDAVTSPSRRGRRRLRADWWGPCPSSPEAPWRATPLHVLRGGKARRCTWSRGDTQRKDRTYKLARSLPAVHGTTRLPR